MKPLLILFLGIFVSITIFQDLSGQNFQIDVQEKTLGNGVKILVWERPSAGRVGARMFYKVDIAAERPGTVGLTHMLEHHLFKGSNLVGTENWEQEQEIARKVEQLERMITDEKNSSKDCFIQRSVFEEVEEDCRTVRLDSLETELIRTTEKQNSLANTTWYDVAVQSSGGTNSTASTGRDWMKFDIDLPANKLELFMWTERSRVEHPVFRHFEPEKEVVVDQIRRYDNRPDGAFSRVMRSMTYDAHPYGWAHWFSDLTQATREDHWEIFYKYFIPQNTIISVVGDVEAETVFDLAETYWGSWQKGRPSPRLRTVEPEPVGQKRLKVESGAGPAVSMHVPMPAVGHPDAHVFDLMEELLGSAEGLLETHLVDSLGIATRVRASAWQAKYPSHFEIRIDGSSNNDLDKIEAGINEAVISIANKILPEEQIRAAASRLVLGLAKNMDEIGSSSVTIGAMEAIYGWNHLNDLQFRWQNTSADDLARVAETYFVPSMQTVGHLKRSHETPESAEAMLLSDPVLSGEFSRHSKEFSSSLKPTDWSAGGHVSDFFNNPIDKLPAISFMKEAKSRVDKNSAGIGQSESSEPVAIAEQPWFTPPWMSDVDHERFTSPMPVDHWQKLDFDEVEFNPPHAEEHRITLRNGFRAYLQTSSLLPMVQLSLFINSPKVAELKGKEGVSELTATLLRNGNRKVQDDKTLNRRLVELGAELSTQTSRKGVSFHLTASSDVAEEMIALMGSLFEVSDISPELESVRERMASNVERELEQANQKVLTSFEQKLYGENHPYGRHASGSTVRSITEADVLEWIGEYYEPANMTLAITGPIEREQAQEWLQMSGFAELEGGRAQRGRYFQVPEIPVINGHQVLVEPLDTRQGHVIMGHPGIKGTQEDHAALEVMNYILSGGGFVSRMMELLRTQTGITSALYGEVEPGIHTKYPYMWRFSGKPETLAQGIRLALQEIRDMKENGVSEEEFEAARTAYIDGLIPASYDTPHKTAERLAYHELHGMYTYQSPQYLNYYAGGKDELDVLRELTLEDVNNAAEKYLDPDNIVIVIGGPIDQILEGASDEIKSILGW